MTTAVEAAALASPRGVAPNAVVTGPRSHRLQRAAALALLGSAFLADYFTGNEASSSLYYLAAVAWSAWFLEMPWGLAMAVASGAAWLFAYMLVPGNHTSPVVLAWNVAGELAVYGGAAVSLGRLRVGIARTRALATQLLEANARLDREAQVVGRLQTDMLPAAVPTIPGHEWSVHYETSTRAGGDYYDFAALPDGRVGVLVADASGHGPAAAVLMAVTRAVFHDVSRRESAPERVLAAMNGPLCGQLPSGWFVTACEVAFDPATGEFDYSLAAHVQPLVVRAASGQVEVLELRGGLMLGAFPGAAFEAGRSRLGPGDALVLYTDGLTEAGDPAGRLLGDEAVREALAAGGDADATTLRDRLLACIARHRAGAPASDDLTLLVLSRLGSENPREAAAPARPATS